MSGTIALTTATDSGNRMIDVRTTKVLGALLVAMTVGALLLMAMESEPPRSSNNTLASIRSGAAVGLGNVSHPWRRIVVHSSTGGKDTLPGRCHFVVSAKPDAGGVWIRSTACWKRQVPGHHVYVKGHDFNADSIGVCLIGDFSNRSPDSGQFEALLTVIHSLQRRCGIKADSIYLSSELSSKPQPGRAFPVGEFNSRLGR